MGAQQGPVCVELWPVSSPPQRPCKKGFYPQFTEVTRRGFEKGGQEQGGGSAFSGCKDVRHGVNTEMKACRKQGRL